VRFNNLGLVVVDEEQRFGVSHKEKFKTLRKEVDVLTLSATPIPRTLHMALAGIRDMSIIRTPPEARLPVKTFVSVYSDDIIKEAILREMERGGQVFFLHNRVRTIDEKAAELLELIPEARVVVGHGQMPEDDLENVNIATGTHWSDREECPKCPVLHLCQGACLFLPSGSQEWKLSCDNSYSDNVVWLAAALYELTGHILYRIESEGDLPEYRQDIFGFDTAAYTAN